MSMSIRVVGDRFESQTFRIVHTDIMSDTGQKQLKNHSNASKDFKAKVVKSKSWGV